MLKLQRAAIEFHHAEVWIDLVYAPTIEESVLHLCSGDPFVFVIVDSVLGGVGDVKEKEGISGMDEMRIEIPVTLQIIPLSEVKLEANVGALVFHITEVVGRLYGHQLPHAVEVAVHRDFVASGEKDGEEEKEGEGEAWGHGVGGKVER